MARGDMRSLVTQHRGQLRLGIQVGQQAAVHVDVAATGREGIDRTFIEDGEFPVQVGHVAVACDALPDRIHVILDGLVFVDAVDLMIWS